MAEDFFPFHNPPLQLPGYREQIRDERIIYPGQGFGDAPENILAVENLATGAAKADWVMQADILSPLALLCHLAQILLSSG